MTTPLALTMGEPAGIGPDLVIAAWQHRERLQLPELIVFGCAQTLTLRAKMLGVSLSITRLGPDTIAQSRPSGMLQVVDIPAAEPDCCGTLIPGNGTAVIASIDQAVAATINGICAGLVTCPIHKKNLYEAGFSYPGHTEYLGFLATQHTGQPYTPVMLIASELLRTVPVTIHIPLSEVPMQLTSEMIKTTIRICHAELKSRFGISQPRLAVAGLNPHAGENGSIGLEDRDIIAPALQELRAEGFDITGPLPADTMFHPRARSNYDVAICMYHDQALIPAKTLAFDEGVNVTLGLPFVRTSPDHGTALDLAGKGSARPDSLICAIRMANDMISAGRA
uniref:4-hydroxythreonine-4-phosphate dehydrogenase PdxA n=1 Tax=Pararhizobium sp. IMCC3301 TaxID=3067904 RepID=UPI0027419D30|nr:4-hydroxythreonine-4-phosphate dehydrogenase PdxA [Pararhizobium sp. IMCC3301]